MTLVYQHLAVVTSTMSSSIPLSSMEQNGQHETPLPFSVKGITMENLTCQIDLFGRKSMGFHLIESQCFLVIVKMYDFIWKRDWLRLLT